VTPSNETPGLLIEIQRLATDEESPETCGRNDYLNSDIRINDIENKTSRNTPT
jgi:hypothetical protein